MEQAESSPTPVCPSLKAAQALMAALAARARPMDDALRDLVEDQLDDQLDAASWRRPASADGALMHLVLGYADAAVLAHAGPAAQDALERRMSRHLYAVAHYLLTRADLRDPAGWTALFDFAMPRDGDRVLDALHITGASHV